MLIWGLGFFTIAGDYFFILAKSKAFLTRQCKVFSVFFATYVVLQLG
jgi:hypothetical protein